MIARTVRPAVVVLLLLAGCMGIKPPLDLPVPEKAVRESDVRQDRTAVPEALAMVRVTVASSADSIRIADGNRILVLRAGAGGAAVTGSGGTSVIVANGERLKPGTVSAAVCTVGTRAYAGDLEVWCTWDTVRIVNLLDVEEYLKGVLPLEMGKLADADSACLQAQAVAARTYALYRLMDGSGEALAADVLDQMYGGASVYFPSCTRAVDATRGEVLTCQGELVKANYFSCCGGKTELPQNIWPDRDPGCFVCVEDTFCRISRHFTWEEGWSRREMERLLYASDADSASDDTLRVLRDMTVKNRLPSGRVDTLLAVLDTDTLVLARDRLRWALRRPVPRAPILRSTQINVELLKNGSGAIDSVVVKGGGNGHGAGMCQWGAIGRGRAGQDYRQILKAYYPNMMIEKRY